MDARFAQLKSDMADRYVLERELGAGGMATVYLAHDPRRLLPVPDAVREPARSRRGWTLRTGRG
jgi:serine/threonine-protein kinase